MTRLERFRTDDFDKLNSYVRLSRQLDESAQETGSEEAEASGWGDSLLRHWDELESLRLVSELPPPGVAFMPTGDSEWAVVHDDKNDEARIRYVHGSVIEALNSGRLEEFVEQSPKPHDN